MYPIIETFDMSKINDIAYIQIAFLFFCLSIYYYFNKSYNRATLLYFASYIAYYKYSELLKNDDLKVIYDLSYFILSFYLLLIILYLNNFSISTNILIILIGIMTIISYSLTNFDLKINTNNNYIVNWSKLLFNINNKLYPNNDKTKQYHYDNFWSIFDFNLLSFIICL